MESLGLFIFISVIFVISFLEYRNGGESWLFKDKTEIEFNKREIQKLESEIQILELKAKLESLKKKEKNETEN